MRNSIIVNLPGVDATTGKIRKVIHDFLIIKSNLEMRHGRILEFTEADGTAVVPINELQRQVFLPKQINFETDNKLVDPMTGSEVEPGTENAISDLEYWQNIPITANPAIAALKENVREQLAGIKVADLVYWMIEQSIIRGSVQGKY